MDGAAAAPAAAADGGAAAAAADDADPLAVLPVEVLVNVGQFLHVRDALALSAVNRRLSRIFPFELSLCRTAARPLGLGGYREPEERMLLDCPLSTRRARWSSLGAWLPLANMEDLTLLLLQGAQQLHLDLSGSRRQLDIDGRSGKRRVARSFAVGQSTGAFFTLMRKLLAERRVVGLRLDDEPGLTAEDLKVLGMAETLCLTECRLTEPGQLAALCNVKRLHLRECQLAGLEQLSAGRFEVLDLDFCVVDNPTFLPLTAARKLSLRGWETLSEVAVLPRSPLRQLCLHAPLSDLRPLAGLEALEVAHADAALTDVSPLSGLRQVVLGSAVSLTNVRPLAHVRHVRLFNCPALSDVSALGSVETLVLHRCPGVTDVSALGGVCNLDLTECVGISDVSALGRVSRLVLDYCSRVSDVSALGRVDTLSLTHCAGVTDVSALGGVRVLDLSHNPSLTKVGALGSGHVQQLNLSHCAALEDVSGLGQVHTLDISECPRIADVSSLGGVRSLTMNHLPRVVDVSALGAVEELNLYVCENLRDVSALGHVERLSIGCNHFISDFSALQHVTNLHLGLCKLLTDVSALAHSSVETLSISVCNNLEDVAPLGAARRLRDLTLHSCARVRRVDALHQIPFLNFTGCESLAEVAALGTGRVQRLNLCDCPLVESLAGLESIPWLILCAGTGVAWRGGRAAIRNIPGLHFLDDCGRDACNACREANVLDEYDSDEGEDGEGEDEEGEEEEGDGDVDMVQGGGGGGQAAPAANGGMAGAGPEHYMNGGHA